MVTPTFLYGAGTWTLSADRAQRIRSAHRRMLRWILGAGRRVLSTDQESGAASESSDDAPMEAASQPEFDSEEEPEELEIESWIDWVRRTTHIAEENLRKAGLEDWVRAVRRKQWRWAGHIARRADDRWSTRLLTWTPCGGSRCRGRPNKRWGDQFDDFFAKYNGSPRGLWHLLALHRDDWHALENAYANSDF